MSSKKCLGFKDQVLETCKNEVLEKLVILEKELKYLSHDIAQDTKSSAGDKFETSREMANREIDKLQGQVNSMNKAMTQLNTIPASKGSTIALGNLIETDGAWIYISISLGQVKVNKEHVLVISSEAPLARELMGKSSGEKVSVNSIDYKVKTIC